MTVRDVIQPLVKRVEEINDCFVRKLWMVILDASTRSLTGIMFFTPQGVDFDKEIKGEDVLYWCRSTTLCFISWIYYFYPEEYRQILKRRDYLYFESGTCGGRMLQVYRDLFATTPNCADIMKYALGLREDEHRGISVWLDFDAVGKLALKDYDTIGRELLENIWRFNTEAVRTWDGEVSVKAYKSNPVGKKIVFLGSRLWQAHEQIIQPFLTKNPIGKPSALWRIMRFLRSHV